MPEEVFHFAADGAVGIGFGAWLVFLIGFGDVVGLAVGAKFDGGYFAIEDFGDVSGCTGYFVGVGDG